MKTIKGVPCIPPDISPAGEKGEFVIKEGDFNITFEGNKIVKAKGVIHGFLFPKFTTQFTGELGETIISQPLECSWQNIQGYTVVAKVMSSSITHGNPMRLVANISDDRKLRFDAFKNIHKIKFYFQGLNLMCGNETVENNGQYHKLGQSFVVGKYNIKIHPFIKAFSNKQRTSSMNMISYISEITCHDSDLDRSEIENLIEAIGLSISFISGKWRYPFFLQGFNKEGQPVWECWHFGRIDEGKPSNTPFTFDQTDIVYQITAGISKLMGDDLYRDHCYRIIAWHIQTVRENNAENTVVVGQIIYESLAYIELVEKRNLLTESDYDKLSAASKLSLLLDTFYIQIELPEKFQFLKKAALGDAITGPQKLTSIRNTLVHPKRKKLNKVKDDYINLVVEAGQLSIHYNELILMRILGYRGRYFCRIDKNYKEIK